MIPSMISKLYRFSFYFKKLDETIDQNKKQLYNAMNGLNFVKLSIAMSPRKLYL